MKFEELLLNNRKFLKAHDWEEIPPSTEWEPDFRKDVAPPPLEKPLDPEDKTVELIKIEETGLGTMFVRDAIGGRMSRRNFGDEHVSLEELSFLLWATQGVHSVSGNHTTTRRTVPSGGNRHPFETYLIVNRVEGLEPGVYRYLPLEHLLTQLGRLGDDAEERLTEAGEGQAFIARAAVVFVWTAIPYRAEWRYSIIAHKDIAIEAGHVCQNLYLACEAVGAGTCAVTSYHQKKIDELIGVDGEEEFTVYMAPVGKI